MNDSQIISLAEKYLHRDFSDVVLTDTECVVARKIGGKRTAGGKTVPQKLRALSLLAFHESECEFSLQQTPRFTHLGTMVDVSRGGVLRFSKVKEFIDRMALFGANELMLYTEDIYTLKDYPHFGYLRGAYSDEELREINRYGTEMDVEIVPCIQTLGHMEQYLSWGAETEKIKDTDFVLLCDAEETYRFIEAEIAKMRAVFSSKKIHIGMDEAMNFGLGNYFRKNGYTDRFALFKRHLTRVCDICKKYGFEPMIWSDMFFRTGSKSNNYYDLNTQMPEDIADGIPDCDMVYWDYYHHDEKTYRDMITLHRKLKRPIIFAGGLATWYGFLPNYELAESVSVPAVKACMEENIDSVIATLWGDDGCETDYFRGIYNFACYSEGCYHETPDDLDHIRRFGAFMTDITDEQIHAANLFHQSEKLLGKRLVWADPFFKMLGFPLETTDLPKQMMAAGNALLQTDEYSARLLRVASMKGTLFCHLQDDYKNGKDLTDYRDRLLPQLIEDFERLGQLHLDHFLVINKPFGLEQLQIRYAGAVARLRYAIRVLDDYICGKTDKIEELDYTPLNDAQHGLTHRRNANVMI